MIGFLKAFILSKMIYIRTDYNDFAKRFSTFLNSRCENINIDILPYNAARDRYIYDLEDAPFACNPGVLRGKMTNILYRADLVELCEFTQAEQDACLLHEIGHLIISRETDITIKEILCDQIAVDQNMSLPMLSALNKMQDKLGIDLQERIDILASKVDLCRPEWTCGSFNNKKRTAIVYNLIEGKAHFFEDYSADVIGAILTFKRNEIFKINDINKYLETKLDISSLADFASLLIELGLLATILPLRENILKYRKIVAQSNRLNYNEVELAPSGSLDYDLNADDAEDAYAKSIDGWSNITFELTYRCSESCIHCYNEGSTHFDIDINKRGERNELTIEEYKRVIDEFKEMGMFKVCLTGGDPFSKSSIWDILSYLYEKEIAVDIYTNGLALEKHVDKLLSLYPRIVGLSVYSAIPSVHDKITRTPGSLGRTLSVMEQLSINGVPLQLKCCVFNTNFESYTTVYDLARKFCALPQIEINIRNTVDGNNYASLKLRLSDEQYKVLFSDPHVYPTITKETLDHLSERDYSKNVCKSGVCSCTLTPEGKIIPCPAFHMTFGNVRDSSLNDIFESKEKNWWKTICLNDYKDCGKHQYCSLCAVCPGENYSETGNPLQAADNKCFLAKKRYNYAIELYEK